MCCRLMYRTLAHGWITLVLVLMMLSPVAGEELHRNASLQGMELVLTVDTSPVVIDGVTLFKVRGIQSFPAERRAREIAGRIKNLATDPKITKNSLTIEESPAMTRIMAGKNHVVAVFDADADVEGIDRTLLATSYQIRIGEALESWRHDREWPVLKRNIFFAGAATILLVLLLWGGTHLRRRLLGALERLKLRMQDIQIQKFQILRRDTLYGMLSGFIRMIWLGLILLVTYFYLHGVLSLFPWTRGFASRLFTILIDPLRVLGMGFIGAVPNLVFLLILFFVARYILKLIRLFFAQVDSGTITLASFEAEWAWPTFRLVRIFLIAFALIIAFPYIPGSSSGAFKGISIFIGVLFSLGSSSLIGNMIAGYTMVYRRAFRVGDRIRLGDQMGDVLARRLLVTHLRTVKNEEVVIPNSSILNGEIVNYSSFAREEGLILHATVGIGYETPWRQVEAMLLEAAVRVPGLLREPQPFVLEKQLGDFCVTYEINAYCSDPRAMGRLYSVLHQNILDVFNKYGVQIMTPSYERDPEEPKLVPKERWYEAPAKPPEMQKELAAGS